MIFETTKSFFFFLFPPKPLYGNLVSRVAYFGYLAAFVSRKVEKTFCLEPGPLRAPANRQFAVVQSSSDKQPCDAPEKIFVLLAKLRNRALPTISPMSVASPVFGLNAPDPSLGHVRANNWR